MKYIIPEEIRWSHSDSFHVTLKFLGDIKNPDLNLLIQCINIAFKDEKSLNLSTTKLGVFPNHRKPHTLWIGIGGLNLGALLHRRENLQNALADNGFPIDSHIYTPHLTIGRMQKGIQKSTLTNLQKYLKENNKEIDIQFEVKEIFLIKSNLNIEGPSYKTIGTYQLSI